MAQWFDVLVERSPSLALKRVTDCLVAAPVPVCAHVQSCMIMPEETRDLDLSGRSTRHRAGRGVCVCVYKSKYVPWAVPCVCVELLWCPYRLPSLASLCAVYRRVRR